MLRSEDPFCPPGKARIVELVQQFQLPAVEHIGHQAADHGFVVFGAHTLLARSAYMILRGCHTPGGIDGSPISATLPAREPRTGSNGSSDAALPGRAAPARTLLRSPEARLEGE